MSLQNNKCHSGGGTTEVIFKWYRENKRSRRFVARDDTGEGERNDTRMLMGIDRNDTGMK